MEREGRGLLAPLGAMVLAMAGFQLGGAVAKGIFPAVGAEGAAALRLTFATLMLTAVTRPWRNWPRGEGARGQLLMMVALGAASAGAMLMFYMALERLPQGIAIALQFLGPLSVAVAGSRRWRDLLWAALAAAGVWGLVGNHAAGAGPLDPWGIVWALGAAASWAAYILVGRRVGQGFGSGAAAIAAGVGAIIVAPIGWLHAGPALFDPAVLPTALFIALVSVAIPFSLELYALPRMPARTFAVFTSIEPVFGALSGFFLLHERLSAPQVLGVAAVIAAAMGAAAAGGSKPAGLAEAPLD